MGNERRGDELGRRREDRWVAQAIAGMEIRLGKTEDHVDEVDDYLRGSGTGRKSLDTRIELMESELAALSVLARKMSDQFGSLMETTSTRWQEIRGDIAQLKIHKAISEGTEARHEKREATRLERFKEWMKFWGALAIAVIALIVPLATLLIQNWDRLVPHYSVKTNVDRWMTEIERRKQDPATKKMLKDRYGVDEP